MAFVAGILHQKHRIQRERQQTWTSALATVEDVRIQPIALLDTPQHSGILYEVDILAKYAVDGSTRTQWITLSQVPKRMDDARLQALLLKGKQGWVRWKPEDTDHVIVEIN